MRLFCNHYLTLIAISSVRIPWPPVIEGFTDTQKTIGQLTNVAFSFDCIIYGDDSMEPSFSVFYTNIVVYIFLPFIVMLSIWMLVFLVNALAKTYEGLWDKMICTGLVTLFLMQPAIVQKMT